MSGDRFPVVVLVCSAGGLDALSAVLAPLPVHRFGGTVIVSSLETSTEQAMPQATIGRDDITGYVVPLADLPGLLLDLVLAPVITPTQKLTVAAEIATEGEISGTTR